MLWWSGNKAELGSALWTHNSLGEERKDRLANKLTAWRTSKGAGRPTHTVQQEQHTAQKGPEEATGRR